MKLLRTVYTKITPSTVPPSILRYYSNSSPKVSNHSNRWFRLGATGVTATIIAAAWQSISQPRHDNIHTRSSPGSSPLTHNCVPDEHSATHQMQRTDTILELDTLLTNGEPLVIIRGAPGIGKTHLVQQYVEDHATRKRYVIRLSVSTLEELRQTLNNHYLAVNELISSIEPDVLGMALAKVIQKYPNCLLVFDGVNNADLLSLLSETIFSSLHPKFPHMQAIVTTNLTHHFEFPIIDVQPLTLTEGLALIKELLYQDNKFAHLYDDEAAKELCNFLNNNPLAIRLAITCILNSKGIVNIPRFMEFAALENQKPSRVHSRFMDLAASAQRNTENVKSSLLVDDFNTTNHSQVLLKISHYIRFNLQTVFNNQEKNETASCKFAVHEADRTGHGQPFSELANILLPVYALCGNVGIPENMLELLLQNPKLLQLYPGLQSIDRYAVRGFNAQLVQYGVVELSYKNDTCFVHCKAGIAKFLTNICKNMSQKLVLELVQVEAQKILNSTFVDQTILQSLLQMLQLLHDEYHRQFVNIASTAVPEPIGLTRYPHDLKRYQSLINK